MISHLSRMRALGLVAPDPIREMRKGYISGNTHQSETSNIRMVPVIVSYQMNGHDGQSFEHCGAMALQARTASDESRVYDDKDVMHLVCC